MYSCFKFFNFMSIYFFPFKLGGGARICTLHCKKCAFRWLCFLPELHVGLFPYFPRLPFPPPSIISGLLAACPGGSREKSLKDQTVRRQNMPAVLGRHKIATDSLPPVVPAVLLFLFASRRSVHYKCGRKVRPLSKARRETGSRFAAASCLSLCLPAFARNAGY